jgi:CobQ-like glutamine amidotransferase family enzyme
MTYRLRLAHLYPEQMNIYGDRGNIIALARRCAWRGIDVEVLPVGPGTPVDWAAVDLAFFGGGQDSGQALIADDFVRRQAPALARAVEGGLPILAICGGYQLLGHYFLTHTGERLPGAGLLDLHTVGGETRLIGNIVVEAELTGDERRKTKDERSQVEQQSYALSDTSHSSFVLRPSSKVRLVGFENHSGRTYLGAGVRPLGRVLAGYGNNGEDGTEGAVYRNVYGCYMHGSLLPKNPQLADHLIGLALARRYGPIPLPPLDDTLELGAQRTMVERIVA